MKLKFKENWKKYFTSKELEYYTWIVNEYNEYVDIISKMSYNEAYKLFPLKSWSKIISEGLHKLKLKIFVIENEESLSEINLPYGIYVITCKVCHLIQFVSSDNNNKIAGNRYNICSMTCLQSIKEEY